MEKSIEEIKEDAYANATATGTVSDNDLITILLSRHELGMLEAHTPLKRVLNHLAGTKSQDLMTASQARTVVQPTTEYLQTPSPKSRGDRQETKERANVAWTATAQGISDSESEDANSSDSDSEHEEERVETRSKEAVGVEITNNKTLRKELMKSLPKFTLETGMANPTHATQFCTAIKEVVLTLGWTDVDAAILLKSRLDTDMMTTSWLSDLKRRGKVPASMEAWVKRIYKKCNVATAHRVAVSNLRFYSMAHEESLDRYYGRYRVLFDQTHQPDDHLAGDQFTRSLTKKWLSKLICDPDFIKKEKKQTLTIEKVYVILKALSQRERMVEAKAHATTPPPKQGKNNTTIRRIIMSAEERKKLLAEGKCFACKRQGHRKGDPICEAIKTKETQVAVASAKMTTRNTKTIEKVEEDEAADSSRYPVNDIILSNHWTLVTKAPKAHEVRQNNKRVPARVHNPFQVRDKPSLPSCIQQHIGNPVAEYQEHSLSSCKPDEAKRRGGGRLGLSVDNKLLTEPHPRQTVSHEVKNSNSSSNNQAISADKRKPRLREPKKSPLEETKTSRSPLEERRSIQTFIASLGPRPTPNKIISQLDGEVFSSEAQAVTMGRIGTETKNLKMPILADLGAQASLISPEWADKLALEVISLEEPIEATFANGSQHRIDTYVVTEVRIGSTYLATVSLLVCPIGDQVILGMPWFDTIKAEIDIGNKLFQFQPRFWAKSKGTLKHWHQFPLASPLELVKWNSKQKRTKDLKLEDSNKSKSKSNIPVAKKDRSGKYIALIKLDEVKRYRKNAQIYHIDIKEAEAGEIKKLDPESTVKDIQNWSQWPPELKDLATRYQDRFEPPSNLTRGHQDRIGS